MVLRHFIPDLTAHRYHMTTEQSALVCVVCSAHTCPYWGVKNRSFEVRRPRVDIICIALRALCRHSGNPSQRLRYRGNSVVGQLLCVQRCEREYRRCWLCSGWCQRVLFLNVKFASCVHHHEYLHLTLYFYWFCLGVEPLIKGDGTGYTWIKLHNWEFRNLHPSTNIINMIKSRRICWAKHGWDEKCIKSFN
jgi:hypothetical protein